MCNCQLQGVGELKVALVVACANLYGGNRPPMPWPISSLRANLGLAKQSQLPRAPKSHAQSILEDSSSYLQTSYLLSGPRRGSGRSQLEAKGLEGC